MTTFPMNKRPLKTPYYVDSMQTNLQASYSRDVRIVYYCTMSLFNLQNDHENPGLTTGTPLKVRLMGSYVFI